MVLLKSYITEDARSAANQSALLVAACSAGIAAPLLDCASGDPGQVMEGSRAPESFRSLLLRHRGRTGLIQRDLAARARVSQRSLQDWEAGVTLPTAAHLQPLIRALVEAGGLAERRETSDARELWAAVQREAPRMHAVRRSVVR